MTTVATPRELGTVLRAIDSFRTDMCAFRAQFNSFKAEFGTLKFQLKQLASTTRCLELRVRDLEDAADAPAPAPTPQPTTAPSGKLPVAPTLSMGDADGGVALPPVEPAKSLITLPKHSPLKDITRCDLAASNAARQENGQPVKTSDLQYELQPLNDGISNLTRSVAFIETVLTKMSLASNDNMKTVNDNVKALNKIDKTMTALSISSNHNIKTLTEYTETLNQIDRNVTMLSDKSTALPVTRRPSVSHHARRLSLSQNDGGNTTISDFRFPDFVQEQSHRSLTRKRSRSTSPTKQRRMSNNSVPLENPGPIFGQPSTPALPLRHRLSINVDRSPFGKYDKGDERSPFSQLSTSSIRFNGGGKNSNSRPTTPLR